MIELARWLIGGVALYGVYWAIWKYVEPVLIEAEADETESA
jgi:hypothetical protein